ncbi:MAG: shikimate dehydrogenase [Candidatus Omnitrophica bacterium]|nr:shikimate dehydrogenase [Candidatus Omnitrophota bacterium]
MHAAGDPELKVYGIFGFPLAHTVSPAIQNCAFGHYHLKSIYFAFERPPKKFRFLMQNLKSLLLDGFNVTVPFKETVIPYLDRLSREARVIGAVNTVSKENGRWAGYNTDLYGFLAGLKESRFNPKGKSAVILGAGGSARAVSFALASKGVRGISVSNRTRSRALSLVQKFKRFFPKVTWKALSLRGEEFKQALSQANLIVNATKVGLNKKDRPLISRNFFPKRKALVYDLIYKPPQTQLLRLARRLGHRTINGETMLLYQGAKAFQIWSGKPAPIRKMRKALHDAIHSR